MVLLEADAIGSGSTGNSTGNLYETLSQGLHTISSHWDRDVARQVVAQRRAAIGFIEELADQADCGFRRCDLCLYAVSQEQRAAISQEFTSLSQAGCNVRLDASVPAPLPQPVSDAVVLQGQAQFHPQAYVAHIAQLAAQAGAQLYEHSRVIELDPKARLGSNRNRRGEGPGNRDGTHTPKGFHLVQAEMPVHREYGIARPLTGADPGPGIFWWRGDERYSVRTMQWQGRNFLVCVGQEHKVGIHNAKASLMVMESAIQQQSALAW